MPPSIRTPEADAELAAMRKALEDEASDIRRAISNGEVDAFVVGEDSNRRVLLLATAYQRYRQIVERMQQGALTVTSHGNILYANQKFADMLGIPLAQLYTAPLEAYVGVGDRARLSGFLLVSARDSTLELNLSRRDGAALPVRLSLATYTDGYATLLATDMRPQQWPSLTVDALDAIRGSLARAELDRVGEQLDALARMVEEMRDVEGQAPSAS